eukprot:3920612-Prorocentrum_lima.AAC.1
MQSIIDELKQRRDYYSRQLATSRWQMDEEKMRGDYLAKHFDNTTAALEHAKEENLAMWDDLLKAEHEAD